MARCLALVPALIAGLLLGHASARAADPWPTRPIRWVVPYVPGGGTDITARLLASKLSEALGQQIVVDNRGGSGGNVGTELVVNAQPDGYTWLFMTVANAINDSLYTRLPFQVERDLAPVGLISSLPNVLEVRLQLPIHSVPELIAYGKANPGKLNFGSGGTGTSVHLSGELFKVMTGITMEHVPYRGAAAALNDVIAGQIDLLFDNLPGSIEQIRGGRVRALAVTSAKRSDALPDLPTIAEAGVPGFEASGWYGIGVPAKTPREIVTRINAELVRTLKLPEIRERIGQLGSEPIEGTPEAMAAWIHSEIAKWTKVVQASGAKAD
ncbi:MAG: tripartite tricarboxylate transporter substrate binding protein [Alphaproteobacteria bacterium]|nr:tripartite tricarboxylate transporter substrate binding protein [Alphaproteobacteria bacterium]